MSPPDAAHAIHRAQSGDWKPLLDLACVHGFFSGYQLPTPPISHPRASPIDAFNQFSSIIYSSRPLLFQALEATPDPRRSTESLLACCPPQLTSAFCSLLLSFCRPDMFQQLPDLTIIELLVAHADPTSSTLFDNALACSDTGSPRALLIYMNVAQTLGLFSPEHKSHLLLASLRKDRLISSSDKMKCVDLLLSFGACLWDNPACQQLSLLEQATEANFPLNWNYICESNISPHQFGYAPGQHGDLLCQRLASKIERAHQPLSPTYEADSDPFLFDLSTDPYLNIHATSRAYPWHGACLDWMLLRAHIRSTSPTSNHTKHL
jgi:hypothetical protein